jgi:hypothetical protein
MRLPTVEEYPKTLKIGEHTWHVKFVKRMPKGMGGSDGLCDPNTYTIYIRKGLTLTETFNTFIHECLHSFEESYSLKIDHDSVWLLEKAISDFLMSNF